MVWVVKGTLLHRFMCYAVMVCVIGVTSVVLLLSVTLILLGK